MLDPGGEAELGVDNGREVEEGVDRVGEKVNDKGLPPVVGNPCIP